MGLVCASMSISAVVIIGLILASSGLHWIFASFLVRGSILATWFLGAVMFTLGFLALGAQDTQTRWNLITGMAIIGFCFVISSVVSGIDISKMVTSPATLLGRMGDGIADLLTRRERHPDSVRGTKMRHTLGIAGRVGTSIAIIQLIGILPFPYNVLLFFVYYKFATYMLFCFIPTVLAVWAFSQVYSVRRELGIIEEQKALHRSERDIIEESSSDEEVEATRPLVLENTQPVVVKHLSSQGTQHGSHQSHIRTQPLYSSSSIYPTV